MGDRPDLAAIDAADAFDSVDPHQPERRSAPVLYATRLVVELELEADTPDEAHAKAREAIQELRGALPTGFTYKNPLAMRSGKPLLWEQ